MMVRVETSRFPLYICRMFFRRYRAELLIAAVALAIAACWWPIRMRFPFDDTYITFRYAANLAHGFGIVWNPGGAHTEGYTNFLLVLLLAPFSALGWELAAVSQVIGVIAVAISAIAIFRIIVSTTASESAGVNRRNLVLHFGWFAVALFLLDSYTWLNAFSGLETSLFTMWLLLVILAVQRSHWWLAFSCATLATLTRPEGGLLGFIIVLVFFLFRNAATEDGTPRRLTTVLYPFLVAFVFPLLVYAIWKWAYFGNLFPNSFYVKVANAKYPGSGVLPGFGTLRHGFKGVWYLIVLAVPGLALAVTNKANAPSRDRARALRRIAIPILWLVLLTGFYLFSHLIQAEYERFNNSLDAMLTVFIGILGSIYVGTGRSIPRWFQGSGAVVLAAIVCFHVWSSLVPRGGMGYIERDSEYLSRYTEVAKVLGMIPHHEHITLAWGDAGRLPYLSEMRHIDPIGLNTNAIAHAHSADEVIRYILHARPDLLVIPLLLQSSTRDSCRAIIPLGDGLIGRAYAPLAEQALQAGYKPIVLVPQTVYDLDFLADTTSRYYSEIERTLCDRIGKDSDFLPPAMCIRPARLVSTSPLMYEAAK